MNDNTGNEGNLTIMTITAEVFLAAIQEMANSPNKEHIDNAASLYERMSEPERKRAIEITLANTEALCLKEENYYRAKEEGKPFNPIRHLQ